MSRVTIYRAGSPTPKITLEQIGDDTLEGGVGGWEVLERPAREAMTAWRGTPGMTWTLPLSLDEVDTGISVERDIALLESWGQPASDLKRPPELVVAALVGRAASTARWVINGIEWGDQLRNGSNERIRQDITLTLLRYVPGKILKGPAAKSRGKGGKGGKG